MPKGEFKLASNSNSARFGVGRGGVCVCVVNQA